MRHLLGFLLAFALMITACAPAQPAAPPASNNQSSQPPAAPTKPAATAPTAAPAKPAAAAPTAAPAKPAAAAPTSAPKKELKKIVWTRSSAARDIGEAPYVTVGKEMGYFQEEGLDVDFQYTSGSSQSLQVTAAGKAQFGNADPQVVLAMRQEGTKLKSIYNLGRNSGYTAGVLKDSKIKDPAKELKNMTIGVSSLASGGVVWIKAYAKVNGYNPDKDLKLVAVGTGAQAASAITTGKVDALIFWPIAYAALENMGLEFRKYDAPFDKDVNGTQIATTEDLIAKDPEMVAGFGRAVAKANLFSAANPEAVVRLWWKTYPDAKPKNVDEPTAFKNDLHILQATLDYYGIKTDVKRWGENSLDQWKAMEQFFFDQGVIKAKAPSPADYIDNRFVDKYNDFDHEKVIQQAKNYK